MSTKLEPYAWPGGYAINYMTSCGATLCYDCAKGEEDSKDLTPYIHWEGPDEYCDGCDKPLPSEYGNPNEGEA